MYENESYQSSNKLCQGVEWVLLPNNQTIATWTPLEGLNTTSISPRKKRPSLWSLASTAAKSAPRPGKNRRSTNLGSKKTTPIIYIHPSTIETSSAFLRAINFHPFSTWKLLTWMWLSRSFRSVSHHPSATACRTRDARWQPTAISTQGFHLRLQCVHQVLQIQVIHSYPGIHQDPGRKSSNGKYSNQHDLMEFSKAWTQTWKYLGEVFRNSHQHEWIPMAYSDNRIELNITPRLRVASLHPSDTSFGCPSTPHKVTCSECHAACPTNTLHQAWSECSTHIFNMFCVQLPPHIHCSSTPNLEKLWNIISTKADCARFNSPTPSSIPSLHIL